MSEVMELIKIHMDGDLAPSLEGDGKIFHGQNFRTTCLGKVSI